MPTHSQIAAHLLRDVAGFFRNIGQDDALLFDQMEESALRCEQTAMLLEGVPAGELSFGPQLQSHEATEYAEYINKAGATSAGIAADLLDKAAKFVRTAAGLDPNPAFKALMGHRAFHNG